jgi:5-methylcytosine-specific restriction endonuclease McrA
MKKKRFPRACAVTLLACGLKRCSQCKSILPLDKFHRCKSRRDGRTNMCKGCVASTNKNWYENNLERKAESCRKWRKDNPERIAVHSKNWRRGNPEQVAYHGRKRRALKQEVNENFTEADVKFCLDRAGHKCESCGMTNEEHTREYGHRLHMDHIKPLSEGYALTRDNCQVLCKACNSKKGNKLLT